MYIYDCHKTQKNSLFGRLYVFFLKIYVFSRNLCFLQYFCFLQKSLFFVQISDIYSLKQDINIPYIVICRSYRRRQFVILNLKFRYPNSDYKYPNFLQKTEIFIKNRNITKNRNLQKKQKSIVNDMETYLMQNLV